MKNYKLKINKMKEREITLVESDGAIITFVPSRSDENGWHVCLDFPDIPDWDQNFMSTEEIKKVYNIEL
jgi:hypothetical protein